ncbi:MAG: hypothetical protein R3D59_13950 [Paracoccaceae bacterium]
MPERGYEGTATGFVPSGVITSDKPLFPGAELRLQPAAPERGRVQPGRLRQWRDELDLRRIGVHGGLAGVDLIQLFASATYAQKFGNVSVGVAPTFAFQGFKADGLGAFGAISMDPTALTNNGHDYSVAPASGGIQVDATPNIRIGLLAGQSKMYMTEFDDYAGLFENGGDFDIPASVTAGIAIDLNPSLTVMADWRRIFYSDVAAIGNATTAACWACRRRRLRLGRRRQHQARRRMAPERRDDLAGRLRAELQPDRAGRRDLQHPRPRGGGTAHLLRRQRRKINDTDAFDFSITFVPEVLGRRLENDPDGADRQHRRPRYMNHQRLDRLDQDLLENGDAPQFRPRVLRKDRPGSWRPIRAFSWRRPGGRGVRGELAQGAKVLGLLMIAANLCLGGRGWYGRMCRAVGLRGRPERRDLDASDIRLQSQANIDVSSRPITMASRLFAVPILYGPPNTAA